MAPRVPPYPTPSGGAKRGAGEGSAVSDCQEASRPGGALQPRRTLRCREGARRLEASLRWVSPCAPGPHRKERGRGERRCPKKDRWAPARATAEPAAGPRAHRRCQTQGTIAPPSEPTVTRVPCPWAIQPQPFLGAVLARGPARGDECGACSTALLVWVGVSPYGPQCPHTEQQ